MGYEFKLETDAMRAAAQAISADTDVLRKQTDDQINRIDDICKDLPSTAYNMAYGGFIATKAFLGRSMDIRDRISDILTQVAQEVEKTEQEIQKLFE